MSEENQNPETPAMRETVTEAKTVEMTREDFAKLENDLQNGKTDKLPDGRTIREVQKDLDALQKQQAKELLEREEKKRQEKAEKDGNPQEVTEKVQVTVNPTGAMFAGAIPLTPPPPESDLPEDFPGRKALIAAEIGFETAKAMSREDLLKIAGIGEATADAILNFGAGQ